MKLCHRCKQTKPPEDFALWKNGKDGHSNHCKKCMAIYARERRKTNPEKCKFSDRKHTIKRNHGLLYADWLKMWEGQNQKCLICGISFLSPSDAKTDHDHKTGRIRGLLCHKCNLGLGHFNDDARLLIKAIKYLSGKDIYIE